MKLIPAISFFVFVLSMNDIAEALQVVTMETYKSDINLDSTLWGSASAGILKSHSSGSYQTGIAKTLYINAPYQSGVIASIRLIDLRPNCVDNVTLFDYNSRYRETYCNQGRTARRDYDKRERKTFYAPSGKLGVTFNTQRFGSTFLYDGFQLTFTAINSVPCKSYEYRCLNSRCISNSIRCDGYNHCGDESSELNCYNPTRTGRTVGIAIGSIFLVIGICMAIIYGIRKCRSPVETETIVTTHAPPSYPVNPPPAYSTTINSNYATAYPPPGYTTYPQGHSNPTYR